MRIDFIGVIAVIISILGSVFAYKQLHISRRQTKISQGENEPKLTFEDVSEENEKANKVFLFENLGKPVKDFCIYITDEIFLSRDISEGYCFDVAFLPVGLNLRVNGRYEDGIQKSKGQNQCVYIKEDNRAYIQSFETELRDRLNCSTLIWRRVIMSYIDFEGNKQKKEYMLIEHNLFGEDSDGYKFYNFGREKILDFDPRFQNKNIIIDFAKKELDLL